MNQEERIKDLEKKVRILWIHLIIGYITIVIVGKI